MDRRQKLWQKLKKVQEKALKRNNKIIGIPNHPSDEEAKEKWKKRISEFDRNTFHYVLDLRTYKTLYTHNTELIFGRKMFELQASDLISVYHPNQAIISAYQSHRIQELFIEYKGKVVDESFYFTSQRAIKDRKGKYWNARYLGTAFQFDKNGYITSLIIRWNLFSQYDGEGINSNFDYEGKPSKQNDIIKRELNRKLGEIKADTLFFLGFTTSQAEIIKQWTIKDATRESIAKQRRCKLANISYHSGSIIKKANEIFPESTFKKAKEVALFIDKQNII